MFAAHTRTNALGVVRTSYYMTAPLRSVQHGSTELAKQLPFPRVLLSTVVCEFKHHSLVLPGQNLHLFKCGGFSSNSVLCHLTLFILQLCGRLSCLWLHSPRAPCVCGPLGEEGAHSQLGIIPDQQQVTLLCGLSRAFLSKESER